MEVVKPEATTTAPANDLHATIRGAHSRGSVSPPISATTAERGPVSPFAPNMVLEANQGVFERITKLFLAGQLTEKIDSIPIEMRPKTASSFRCCIYKDRAAIRYRVMAALGLRVEREEDECRTLASYAHDALNRPREKLVGPALTVLEESCNHCMRQQYYVTDACQGCIARPCATNCPKKAIEHVNNRAIIDADACIKCGKCMQVCPYHAIINLPIPCVSACPVGAITALPDGGKHFDWNKCIYCGHCQKACPFGAVMDRSQLMEVLKAIKDPNTKAVAMVAPAAAGHFNNTPMWAILAALKRAGFDETIEVSLGADTTTEEEAAEFVHKFGPGAPPQKHPFMTTSCCPAYIQCIKKHIPEIEEAVSHTPSPMVFTAKLAKERWPGCTTVFIGPCVAKLQEALTHDYTDFALTFIETMGLIRGAGVSFEAMPQPPAGYEQGSAEAKRFAITAGVASAVAAITPQGENYPELKPVIIDGLSQATVKKMKSFAKVPPPGNLVEVMVCEGGCVNGAGTIAPSVTATGRVKAAVAKSVHHPQANNPPIERKIVIIRNGAIVDN